jgi:hypothetical protein
MTMPGLPKHPAAENIDIDENGKITGLFWGRINEKRNIGYTKFVTGKKRT